MTIHDRTIENAVVQDQWNSLFTNYVNRRTRFWESDHIVRHINRTICGSPVNGFSQGLIINARRKAPELPFKRGISIGCGIGAKETALLAKGLVEHFDMFELSDVSLGQAVSNARNAGVADRVSLVRADAFSTVTKRDLYDFIHWDNSLHHMSDVEQAVRWSHHVCKAGGMFFMNEYVGPTRFQWTRNMLIIGNRIRNLLPQRYFFNRDNALGMGLETALRENNPHAFFPRLISTPSIDAMLKTDPSEAADSARILPAVKRYFPGADITITGGAVYHLVLNDILQNFHENDDAWLLDLFLLIDDMMIAMGETHYATAIAIK
jgi:SAM-dependent methyltransferase